MKRLRRLVFCSSALSLAACGGGGVAVNAPGPAPATSAPVSTPTASPTPAAAVSPVAPASAAPTSAPTATPTAASTAAASPAPSPSAAASTSATCTNPNMGSQNETWTLNGSALTIPLPPYGTFTGTLAFPAQSPASTVVSETVDQTNFNFAPTSSSGDPAYGSRTDDFFMSFRLSQSTTFTNGAMTLLPVTIISTCLTSGTTYYLDQFTTSSFVYVNSAVASAGQVTLDVLVSPNPYPAGQYINAVLNH